jgi:hypothetical protein
MVVGVLSIELHLPEADSLKSRRFVLKSLKDRLRKFNVSVAEEGGDLWQRVSLYVACVSQDGKQVNVVLEQVKNTIEKETEVEILGYSIEML